MIRVVIADDQDLIRAGLTAIIDAQPDLKVVAEARDGLEAAAAAESALADVVLMDVQMPRADGIQGAQAVARARPQARVLMLTMYDLDHHVFDALKAGASGFLLKTTSPNDLTDAVRAAHDGKQIFAPSVVDRLVSSYVRYPVAREGIPAALASLTARELEVFLAVARGLSNNEVGTDLNLSEATVKTYVTRILAKLGLRDRVQAVILAYECGAVGSDDAAP